IDDQGVAAYRLYRDGGLLQSVPGVTARDPAAPSTATVCYEVSAVDVACNESGHSNTACLNLAQAWIPREAGTTMNLTAVAWSGSEFVAVGDAQEILVSADGALWKPRTQLYFVGNFNDILWDGQAYVSVGSSTIFRSPDGLNGQPQFVPPATGIS